MFPIQIPTDILRYNLFVFLGYVDFTRASWTCTRFYRHWQYAKSKIPLDCVYIPEHRSLNASMVDCVRVLKNHSLTANLLFVQDHPTLTTVLVDDGHYNIEYPLRNVTIICSKQTKIVAWEHGLQVEGDCCIYGIAIRHVWGETSFSLNNIQSQQMCDGFWYYLENHTARDLFALYQREQTFKYLTNRLTELDDPWWDDSWWANRKPAVKSKLEVYLMKLAETPPHLFDISRYKYVASPIMCISPFPRRPFMDELRARWRAEPFYSCPDKNYKKRKAKAAIETRKQVEAARNASISNTCFIM